MSKKVIAAAMSAVFIIGVGTQAIAADKTKMMKGMEKCYGIAKAGKNDCGSGAISCASSSKTDNDKNAFLLVPKGTCDKIVGGSKTPESSDTTKS